MNAPILAKAKDAHGDVITQVYTWGRFLVRKHSVRGTWVALMWTEYGLLDVFEAHTLREVREWLGANEERLLAKYP